MGRQTDRRRGRKEEKADGGGENREGKEREGDEKVGGMTARAVEPERKKR